MGLAALSTLVFYAAFFCCDFSFAHLARWNAAIFLRADADMVRLGLTVLAWSLALLFAYRAFCAALILLRAAAERVRLGFVAKRPPFNLPRTERAASTCLS